MPRRRAVSAFAALLLLIAGCTADARPESTSRRAQSDQQDEPSSIAENDGVDGIGIEPLRPGRTDDPPDSPRRPGPGAAVVDDEDDIGAVDEINEPPLPAQWPLLQAMAFKLLETAVDDFDDAVLAAIVVDAYGRELLSHRADEPLLPASTLKIATAAAALVTFGPDAVFTTRVETSVPVDADGGVAGDLLLIGSGDPVLSTDEYARWIYPSRLRTPLEDLADAVVEAGVRQVDGGVVGVADRFSGPNVAEGWPDRYFWGMDTRYADGLTVDAGLRTTVTFPQDAQGAPAEADGKDGPVESDTRVDGDPSSSRNPRQDDRETEVKADAPGQDDDERADVEPEVKVQHADDPALHAASELTRLLDERGVEVRGDARTGQVDAAVVGRLAEVESPPMQQLLRFAVQRSDNQITDAIFRAVGRARTGIGSFASGERAVLQAARHLGVDISGVRLADGSGLSRDDRATARFLVDVDRAMQRTRHAAVWRSLMAVTGESGTLQRRLGDGVTAGRFAGKTGTLRDVTAMVGTVHGDDARRYHLAVLVNDPGAARWTGRRLTDELITMLSADLAGCPVSVEDVEAGAATAMLAVDVAC